MSRSRTIRLLGAAVLAAGTLAAVAVPSTAAPAPDQAAPELLAAMQRDFGLTAQQAQDRLAREARAIQLNEKLRGSAGEAFAGSYFDEASGKLVLAVTDGRAAQAAREAGADAVVVSNTERELDAAKSTLDGMEATAPQSITGWYVDVRSNSVVVSVDRTKTDAATEDFLARARSIDDSVRVEEVAESPRTFYDIRGGDAYYMGGRCSVGFAVRTSSGGAGMVTAGHCGRPGTAVSGYNQVAMGTFQGSSFPGNDYAWVSANSNWTPRALVNMYNGSTRAVSGATVAPVGSSICRSGSTTGWRCGSVQAMNQTVRYAEGTVTGLTRTNACAEPGDSGGSFISGTQAQGMTSGGSGNCSSGGTTYFQPVQEALSAYGLRLVTG
ncbi:streptogrisin C [Saccharopolyspora antimicrobica]|uniref:Streptogrisin C n=1 Tax=Saccharopolyspora antimicrobica TaxID=455193 RepID=A0A1I5HB24_9PSEU|nr:S1 family peptidase [Saccharopolyspora antimicrobica]RKT85396.1 streptogrisin C [Saccharopolyspora antimicrobica]SFO45494.1 streptogrisin C [Saccharopolyspora antimicrobica]